MPAKNSIKIYSEDSYYHIYNRGVEKKLIFLDEQDYTVFLSYLRTYLLPKNEKSLRQKLSDASISYKERDNILRQLRLANFYNEITLLAYCLMPNHFHFMIKQKKSISIDQFMNSIGIRYAMYFNKKYKRVGHLFQDVYKAVLIENEPQFLYLSAYIHRNPLKNCPKTKKMKLGIKVDGLCAYYFSQPSSYPEYLDQRKTHWIHQEDILKFFSKTNPKLSYQSFVEETQDILILEPIVDIILDDA
ncbi:MAG: transposase [Candidatus Daviesbacteria bacterium]|nr:transposase [Candidatus Daviesbacteria bacterium]